MEHINSKKIAEIVYSTSSVVDADISEVVTDSRKAGKDSLFVAIKGEKFDGHWLKICKEWGGGGGGQPRLSAGFG